MKGSILVPLGYRGIGAQQILVPNDPLVEQCWAEMEPVQGVIPSGNRQARHRVVLPLRVGNRMIGVAVSSAAACSRPGRVAALMQEVDAHSLRLDTALLFDEVRTMATAEERHRLAREIHDGIAQELASLGYVVDDMAVRARATRADLEGAAGPARRADPGDHRAAAVDLRPAQRRVGHQRPRRRAVRLRPAGRARVRPHRAPRRSTSRPPGCPPTSRPSCCGSPRRRSPTPASTPTRRTCG